ncbi:carbon-nitrogen hydrolase family protein [Synechococcus sp. Nb3U1]|uniref:carbon-nitrogen hydrolase family protein n=1 Tax=Synechococcus sp. Nb3U1 TaxID=1914529 RepID=UPI001F2FA85D|nr:carbon-nitrogen hydrolase family protein [Synechococcus sp. Nb3U1]MCF2970896.1 carbon-nitrogen hydrolase family protein [Synechococcus sp. Nb3U1]
MRPYLAAAIQMTSIPNLATNLQQAEEWIDFAVRQGCELVTLPENFAFMGPEAEKTRLAQEISERAEAFLSKMAQRYQVFVFGGGYPVPDQQGRIYNTAALYDPDGKEISRYRKIHLFDVNLPDGNTYRESSTVVSGDELVTCEHEQLGHLGLSVCYDVRFPELYRSLVDRGAQILLVPAAFTAYTGRDHWQILLQCRAIENTCYVIAPAQVGNHYERRQCHGHAMILDPWGVILADAGGEKPGVAIAEIDPERLQSVRRQMPSIQHRRLACAVTR